MNSDELLQRYSAGERNFKGVDLVGANLHDANLELA
jgi:uncharacterized protein YjbI with pentapeptide repeats